VDTIKVETPLDFEAGLAETRSKLARLERWEWWRWGTVFVISLALTAGLFSLSYPGIRPESINLSELENTLKGLLAMVLLFDVFAFYQQFKISRMRRELSNQLGMLCTLEALRPPSPQEEVQRQNRRRYPRYYLDKRVQIVIGYGRTGKIIFGRTRDISEGGLAAVLPEPLEPETRVIVELAKDSQTPSIRLKAVVCYRRGFSHGFEFTSPVPADVAAIRHICSFCKRS
jgi:hypothetical protein